jgi:hypothetical protein
MKLQNNSSNPLQVLDTIYGNDIDISAIEICKVRLFFEMIKWVNKMQYISIAEILNRNLTNYDFVNIDTRVFKKNFDIIIGNPPYIEDGKSAIVPDVKHGNIYANILENSVKLLGVSGIMGYIIPLSYIATARMGRLRKIIETNTNWQYLYNYADRPGCLFTGVHQKLTIIIAQKGNIKHKVFTSSYQYWYKEERSELFKNTTFIQNNEITKNYYPKLGSKLEQKIYTKVHTTGNDNLLNRTKQGQGNVFLNMRACFWIKAFSIEQASNEFKSFTFDENEKWVALALLNSSIFWWHWIVISDCWHITRKELETFHAPQKVMGSELLATLAQELEKELENTKVEINSKQTTFEYKHKCCRATIDKIDDCLAKFYRLTQNELEYIKGFAKKYRESLGV